MQIKKVAIALCFSTLFSTTTWTGYGHFRVACLALRKTLQAGTQRQFGTCFSPFGSHLRKASSPLVSQARNCSFYKPPHYMFNTNFDSSEILNKLIEDLSLEQENTQRNLAKLEKEVVFLRNEIWKLNDLKNLQHQFEQQREKTNELEKNQFAKKHNQ